jgi:hypothetical protein
MTLQLGGYEGEEVAIRDTSLHFEKYICESPLLHPMCSSKGMSFRAERGISNHYYSFYAKLRQYFRMFVE